MEIQRKRILVCSAIALLPRPLCFFGIVLGSYVFAFEILIHVIGSFNIEIDLTAPRSSFFLYASTRPDLNKSAIFMQMRDSQ